MFVPIGSYYLIEEEKINRLDTEDVSAQVQDVVLKEPISNVRSIEEIKKGHDIHRYLDEIIKQMRLDPFESKSISQSERSFFEPKVEGEGKILWEKQEDGQWECHLIIRGEHLRPLQLNCKRNYFTGTPFEKRCDSKWVSHYIKGGPGTCTHRKVSRCMT